MHPSWVLSFPEGVAAGSDRDGNVVVPGPFVRVVLRQLPGCVRAAIGRLEHPGDSAEKLAAGVQDSHVPDVLARWLFYLQYLAGRGCLLVRAQTEGQPLATLVPTAPCVAPLGSAICGQAYVLSRFAYLRRLGAEMVVECPLSAARIVLHDSRAALAVYALTAPATIAELPGRVSELSADASQQLLQLLLRAGMLTAVEGGGRAAEDEGGSLLTWEFHDLLFHTRSRQGRHDAPVGNTFPGAGTPLPPAVKPLAAEADTIAMFRPDIEVLKSRDRPLAQVMETRRSIREYAADPITAEQLGEFLYRVARVTARSDVECVTPQGSIWMDITSRPYPTGGALYALELYLVVQACQGLEPGLYHYDPVGHQLERLAGVTPDVESLLADAGWATGTPSERLQVLVIVAARFARVAWKYASLAYSLILKDTGCLMQNMYLAATAMDLAPCALGAGNSDRFATAIGSDYYEETSVGEFVLGSKRQNGVPPGASFSEGKASP